jgi:hypothetical protein
MSKSTTKIIVQEEIEPTSYVAENKTTDDTRIGQYSSVRKSGNNVTRKGALQVDSKPSKGISFLDRNEKVKAHLSQYYKALSEPKPSYSLAVNFRQAQWGTLFPFAYEEECLHRNLMRAFTDKFYDFDFLPWRHQNVLGKWNIGKDLILDVGFTHMATYTSTLESGVIDNNVLNQLEKSLDIVDNGSTQHYSSKIIFKDHKRRIPSRYAMSYYKMLRDSNFDVKYNNPTFAHMGSSLLVINISFNFEVKSFSITTKTLRLFKIACGDDIPNLTYDNYFRILSSIGSNQNFSYLRVECTGVLGLVGSPKTFPHLLSNLKICIYRIMSDTLLTNKFLGTLRELRQGL